MRKRKPRRQPSAVPKKTILKPRAAPAAKRSKTLPAAAPEITLDGFQNEYCAMDKRPWMPLPTIKNKTKVACATFAGDILRAANRGARGIFDAWDPSLVIFPAQSDPDPDSWPAEYELGWMRAVQDGEAACAQGAFCQGHQLAAILPCPHGGFTLPIFVSPRYKTYWDACILCARVGHALNQYRGHKERPWAHARPFRATELEYGRNCLGFVTTHT